jgi:hypothetical protein
MPKNESYDEAYQRGFNEGKGTLKPLPPPSNDSARQGHLAGRTEGSKSNQK